MAEGAGEKKHPPTASKLKRLRDQGQWYSSRDLPAAATLGVGALLWSSAFPFFSDKAIILARSAWQTERLNSIDPFRAMEATAMEAAQAAAVMIGMVMIAMFCVAALIQFLQIGPMFSVKPLWNPSRLNPAQGFQNIFFKGQTYKRAAIGFVKAGMMLGLVLMTVWNTAPTLFMAARIGVNQTVKSFSGAFSTFLYQAAVLSVLFGAADYLIQRTQFFSDQKMTDEELKDDTKETEGNPEVKMHLRRKAMMLARGLRH